MAYTPDDLMVIERAIASGMRRVRFSDREVEYQSTKDLTATRSDIIAAVLDLSPKPVVQQIRIYTNKGF